MAPATTASPLIAATAAPAPVEVTITQPVTVQVKYGETVLQRGTRLPLVSRNAQTATLKYGGETIAVPLQSTDLH